MVKVAVAGGTSSVAREVTDAIISHGHDVVVLSRKQINYQDPKQLEQALQEVHTLLSFIVITDDPSSTTQKNLIDAAVRAGVKRFAPSEWATLEYMPWYAFKDETRQYLEELNREHTVLEYTLFQPGLFMNYLTHPFKSADHLHQTELPFDFNNRRFIVPENYDKIYITLTKVQDLAQVVARAVSFEGKWPVVGGVKGTDLSLQQLIALGQRIRSPGGEPFQVETVKLQDLQRKEWSASWIPKVSHPAIPPEFVSETLSQSVVSGMLLGMSAGCFKVSDEWNQLLGYKFTSVEEFLVEAWAGKA
ncbi:hypothetical protein N7478_006709 [Penicillium angulare]|uniref:uncharacterized protein n=1 Tax=Penicillium angulare TaxID=116970 RepID=UPI00254079E3|nr:uncharacterized protein N7478_006709 [Penicillium angulare]KAJ5281337.1 hypothetical protein N7478_006709 [Penicillium angulare]